MGLLLNGSPYRQLGRGMASRMQHTLPAHESSPGSTRRQSHLQRTMVPHEFYPMRRKAGLGDAASDEKAEAVRVFSAAVKLFTPVATHLLALFTAVEDGIDKALKGRIASGMQEQDAWQAIKTESPVLYTSWGELRDTTGHLLSGSQTAKRMLDRIKTQGVDDVVRNALREWKPHVDAVLSQIAETDRKAMGLGAVVLAPLVIKGIIILAVAAAGVTVTMRVWNPEKATEAARAITQEIQNDPYIKEEDKSALTLNVYRQVTKRPVDEGDWTRTITTVGWIVAIGAAVWFLKETGLTKALGVAGTRMAAWSPKPKAAPAGRKPGRPRKTPTP